MLDFFIISSNFPAERAKGESAEVYTEFRYPTEARPGGGHQNPTWSCGWWGDAATVRSARAAGPVPQD